MTIPADVEIRYGQDDENSRDFEWLCGIDTRYVNEDWIRRCLKYNEYIIALDKDLPDDHPGKRLGFLRYALFWGVAPYLNMIRVIEGERRRGVGSALFAFWEDEMRSAGYDILMTSSLRDELEPQTWHWRNGYRESGKLTFGSLFSEAEVFFVKELKD